MLKSGNKSEKNLATELENDSNHNKNDRLKHWKRIQSIWICLCVWPLIWKRGKFESSTAEKTKAWMGKTGLLEVYVLFEI